jgi:linoleoyl-CoA desaturase
MRDPRIKWNVGTDFQLELERRVDHYFATTGLRRDGGARLLIKAGVIFAWFFAGYALFLLGDLPLWAVTLCGVSTGLAMGGLGMAVQHDGGHRAFARSARLNRISARVLDFLGASSHVWHVKHGLLHHTYPNVEGADDDIALQPLARVAPGQRRRPFHRFQHLYMWVFYGFLGLKWWLIDDFVQLARGRIGDHPLKRPRGLQLGIFAAGKLAHLTWAIVLPLAIVGWLPTLVFYVTAQLVTGWTISVTFQLAHCVEEAEFVDPSRSPDKIVLDFAVHQIATTVDFARSNRLLGWYLGGLNFQVVHHLFPRIAHVHYPALSPIIEQTCADFGVRYNVSSTFFAAVRSHHRWLRRMGHEDVPVPEALPGVCGSASVAVVS